jgi:hypothetical protein
MNFLDKRYELNTSIQQCTILNFFNDSDSISAEFLVKEMQIAFTELKRHLKGLLDLGILKIQGVLTGDSLISINTSFSNKRTKIKIPTVTSIEAEQESDEQDSKAVDLDRRMFLEASIVRIMKARKELKHTQLITEVIQQCIVY